jgi:predicted SAM-dependent methyltransferase
MISKLEQLKSARRVSTGSGPENTTPGLIALCQDYLKATDRMVEVGCYEGISTQVFSMYAGEVHAVDPWKPQYESYMFNADTLASAERTFDRSIVGLENVRKHKMTSLEAALELDELLDAVYIDGDHSPCGIIDDISAWVPKLKVGGLLMGHDFNMAYLHLKAAGFTPMMVYPDTSWVCEVTDQHRSKLKLDLACGSRKRYGFYGVDIARDAGADFVCDLRKGLPWPPNSVDQVHCSHFLEHLDGGERIAFMEELWRVLKPGCCATFLCPYYTNVRAVMDPTHKWPPVAQESFLYFDRTWREREKLSHYPITCNFSFEFQHLMSDGVAFQNDEHRRNAEKHYWNVVDDLLVVVRKED